MIESSFQRGSVPALEALMRFAEVRHRAIAGNVANNFQANNALSVFVGPPGTVTITEESLRVTGSASAVLGLASTSVPQTAVLGLCYQRAGGTRSFSEYYTASYDAALFRPRLRENVLFAQHNLATDTSFSEFNVILCRNVLIYFDRSLKERTLRLFGESLAPLGFMCLGRRESLRFTNVEREFEEIDPRERIYRRTR